MTNVKLWLTWVHLKPFYSVKKENILKQVLKSYQQNVFSYHIHNINV